MRRNRCYSDLRRITSFEDRFEYLNLQGVVGESTFGFDRWLNQQFYRSRDWRRIRNHVIMRDLGCDLGVPGYEIHTGLLVHHMNPISADDVRHGEEALLDAEYLVLTSLGTHNAIHYGDRELLPRGLTKREPGDTNLW